jgi:acetyl esterase/lipase
VIGFSAGGQLAAFAGTRYLAGRPDAADPIERESSRPAFVGLVYPAIPEDMELTEDTPPAFLLCGEDDYPMIAEGVARLYMEMKAVDVPVELHVLTGVGHGFGMRFRNPPAVAAWPTFFVRWLDALRLL